MCYIVLRYMVLYIIILSYYAILYCYILLYCIMAVVERLGALGPGPRSRNRNFGHRGGLLLVSHRPTEGVRKKGLQEKNTFKRLEINLKVTCW